MHEVTRKALAILDRWSKEKAALVIVSIQIEPYPWKVTMNWTIFHESREELAFTSNSQESSLNFGVVYHQSMYLCVCIYIYIYIYIYIDKQSCFFMIKQIFTLNHRGATYISQNFIHIFQLARYQRQQWACFCRIDITMFGKVWVTSEVWFFLMLRKPVQII